MNKKEFERLERQRTAKELKARSDSENRKERIKVLWQDLEKELGRLKRARADRDELDEDELVEILTELAPLQKDEIEYLTQFRRELERMRAHYPKQLDNLSLASSMAEYQPLIKRLVADQTPTQKYESKRRIVFWKTVGKIEWEFGGGLEAWAKTTTFLVGPTVPERRCLDGIFDGQPVDMLELQQLFGMHRNRFPKGIKNGLEPYDYRAVTKIMDALLGEPARKSKRRGRSMRIPWLNDLDLRTRVLGGIEARLNSISTPNDIRAAFLAVVHRHLPDSAKK